MQNDLFYANLIFRLEEYKKAVSKEKRKFLILGHILREKGSYYPFQDEVQIIENNDEK